MKTSILRLSQAVFAGLLLTALTFSAQAGDKAKTTTDQTFTVAADAKIVFEGNKGATLADIKTGDHVHLAYTQNNGVNTAVHIRDLGPNPVKKANPSEHTPGAKKAGEKKNNDLHAHGIVQSVDTTGMTLTITEKSHH